MKSINLIIRILSAIIALVGMNCFSQSESHKIIRLYKGIAPISEDLSWDESAFVNKNNTLVCNITVPTLTVHPADKFIVIGTAIVVCSGGVWHTLAIKGEGSEIATWLSKKGITVFVLKYRLIHSLTDNSNKKWLSKFGKGIFYKEAESAIAMGIADGKAAIAYVRAHAEEWGLKTNSIGIIVTG